MTEQHGGGSSAAPPQHDGVRPRHLVLMLASLTGIVMTTWRLGVASIRGDETYYREAATDYLAGHWLSNAQHPPLAKELIALSQATLGDSAIATRLPAAVCGWLTGYLVAAIVWQVTGRSRAGVLAGIAGAVLWWLLPFDPARTALLEGPLCLLMTAATYAWLRARFGHSLWWFAAGGACVGLAVATKLTGALAVAGLVPVLWHLARGRREADAEADLGPRARRRIERHSARPGRRALSSGLVAGAAALVAWVVPYLPMGLDAVEAVRVSVTYQAEHAARGHSYPVAGETYLHPPWWSTWWFQEQRMGLAATVSLWALAAVGAIRHRRRTSPVVASLAAMTVVLAVAPLQLPHYQFVLWPPLVALGAAAWAPAPRQHRAGERLRWRRLAVVGSALAVAVTIPLGTAAAQNARDIEELEASDYRRVGALVESAVTDDTAITLWADPRATRVVLPSQTLTTRLPGDANPPVLVYDDFYASRRDPGMDVDLWVRCRTATYERRDFGAVEVFVRDDSAPATKGERPPECEGLPFAGR